MKRFFILFPILAGIATAGFLAIAKDGHLAIWKSWWNALVNPAKNERNVDRLKVDLFDRMNYVRIGANLEPLKLDPELQKFLERYKDGLPTNDMDQVTRDAQAALPRYFRVSACVASRPTADELLHDFQPFAQEIDKAMTHFACLLKSSTGGLSQTIIVLVGQRLEDFSPEQLNARKTDAFFNACALCGHPHVCRVSYQQLSMTLECPSCSRTYAVVAADSHGRFRYVNEFLSGYQPPARFPKDQSRIEKLFTIWSAVHDHCTYKLDPAAKKNRADCWQTAVETQKMQQGDCEDSSIYLADWLECQGFQVRVALGRYGDMGGHAWCVVRLEDNDYLLESTEGRPDLSNLPLADMVGSRYVPEVMFDRHAIYVRSKARQSWAGDYWSTKAWSRIEPRRPLLSVNSAGTAKVPSGIWSANTRESTRLFADKGNLAVTQSPLPSLAPFSKLDSIPVGPKWELQIPDEFVPEP